MWCVVNQSDFVTYSTEKQESKMVEEEIARYYFEAVGVVLITCLLQCTNV